MADPFDSLEDYNTTGFDAPARNAATINPDNANDLPHPTRALFCTSSGQVQVTMERGQTVILPIVAGAPLPVQVRRVWVANTSATGLVAVW